MHENLTSLPTPCKSHWEVWSILLSYLGHWLTSG